MLSHSRESLAGGVVESKPRPLGSPRLGVASLTKTSEYRSAMLCSSVGRDAPTLLSTSL